MQWFAAHIVMMVKLKKKDQARFPLWENIVLIRASSSDEAFAKAEQRGHEEEGDEDGTFTWNSQPATWVFMGVRKLTSCEPADQRPGDGTEITYLELEAQSLTEVKRFVSGKEATLVVCDRFPESAEESVPTGAANGRPRKRA